MSIGKMFRLRNIMENGKILCVPMDHGVSNGPIKGIEDITEAIRKISKGGATCTVLHKGSIKALKESLPKIGIFLHVSASTSLGPYPNWKVCVADVEEAVKLGIDGISVHVNIGNQKEPDMLVKLGKISKDCEEYGMPLLAMMYARGENIKNQFDAKIITHIARLGAELGADIVKTVYTGDKESFRTVVKGCSVTVIIAGGPKKENVRDTLQMVIDAMDVGAAGVAFGRNVFQNENPEKMVKALRAIIFDNASLEESLEVLNSE